MAWLLSEVKVGEKGTIVGFNRASQKYRQKLISMGVNKGESFDVTRVAPLGDPIEIKLRGYSLSLRKSEASVIQIEKE